jgi:hypothetical protein
MYPGTHAAGGSFTIFQFVQARACVLACVRAHVPTSPRVVECAFCDATCFCVNCRWLQNLGSAVGFYLQVPLPLHGADGTYMQLYLQVRNRAGAGGARAM